MSCGRGCAYAPTVRFTDLSGTVHTFLAPNAQQYQFNGTPVKVSYDPAEPSVAHDLSDGGPWSWDIPLYTMIFVIVLCGLFLVGMAALQDKVRSRQRANQ